MAMGQPQRIYLDNAATSWPKPESVYAAVEDYQRRLGAPAGRGVYREAHEVERLLADARRRVAHLWGAEQPQRIIFTANGTDSLNQVLHGLLKPGDHVVTTVVEHNSVLRPLRFLESERGIDVSRIPCNGQGWIDPDDVRRAIRSGTRLIALIHASNVTGALQPVVEVGRIARQHGVLFLVDAAQSAGELPFHAADLGADFLAAAGHKGLLGPLGVGLLYIAPGAEQRLAPVRQGGTGTQSEEDRQPESLPDRYESGNHNVPGILGLAAGLAFLEQQGLTQLRRRSVDLTARLIDGLQAIEGVQVYGPGDARQMVSVVSCNVSGYDSQEVAMLLDGSYSIQVRSGFHCAPLMHRALGTSDQGGAVRFSPGPFTTAAEIEATLRAVAEIAAAAVGV